QKVTGISVAGPELRERNLFGSLARERRVTTLTVADPEARQAAGEPGEEARAESAQDGHLLPLGVQQTIALDVVGLAPLDGLKESRQIAWAHLIVSGHHDEHVRTPAERAF